MFLTALAPVRLRTTWDKLAWGLRVAGPWSACAGLGRMALLTLLRPARAQVRLRSGPVIEFDYPLQAPPVLLMFGDFIDPEFAFLRLVAKPGWQVIDVGAAIGQFSVFASRCLPGATINAFEPSITNFATLERNIARNGATGRITAHQYALAGHEGTAMFATTPSIWTSHLIDGNDEHQGGEPVSVRTLATVLPELNLGRVHVLKINVAGFEPGVLEGAMPCLAAGQVDVLILLLGLASLSYYQTIAGLGYRFFYYHPEQKTLYEVTEFDENSVLAHRPWPARHIIGIRREAVSELVAGKVTLRSLASTLVLPSEAEGVAVSGLDSSRP